MSRTVHSEHGVGSLSWRSVIEPMTLLATAIARSRDSRLSIASCQHTYLIETSNLELLSATHGVNRRDAAYSRSEAHHVAGRSCRGRLLSPRLAPRPDRPFPFLRTPSPSARNQS